MTIDNRTNEELIADAQAFRGSSDQYAEFITDLADALEAVTLEQDTATEPKNLSIMNGWLVEMVGKHTCGTGPDGHYGAHEPGCGYEPHLNLADLEGWPEAERDAATEEAFKKAGAFDKAVALSERRQTLLEETEAERDDALAAIERVRAAVEKHRHWNEGCGWDVPTIEVLAALDGAPEPEVGLPETGDELRDSDGDIITSGEHRRVLHDGGYVCDTCVNVLGLNVRWDHAVRRDDHVGRDGESAKVR